MRTTRTRTGFTLLEILVVMALLIILAAATLPSLAALKSNSAQKNASDHLRARIADARGLAMQEATPFRLAVHKDGHKLRLGPDTDDFADMQTSDVASGSAKAIETTLEQATISIEADPADPSSGAADDRGWITIGTFLPNGTCREITTIIDVNEANFPPLKVLLRGITGTARIYQPEPGTNPMTSSAGGAKP